MIFLLKLGNYEYQNNWFFEFAVEPGHLLHLGFSEKLEERTVGYNPAAMKRIDFATGEEQKRTTSCEKLPLIACSDPLSAYQKNFSVLRLQVIFSTSQESSHLNGLLTATRVKRMLQGNENSAVDYVSSFISAFLDRVTIRTDIPVLKNIHSLCSAMGIHLLYSSSTR